MERQALAPDVLYGPPKSTCQFGIKVAAEYFDLARGPTAGRRDHAYAPVLTFCDNFLDGAFETSCKDRVRHLAEELQFTQRPSSTFSEFAGCGHGRSRCK